MLLTTENSTQQINAALLDLEKETKSNTKNSIISTVYAIIKGFFDELKQKIGTTGIWSVTQAEYDSLTTSERLEDKYYNVTDASTGFLSVTNTVENGNTQPVTSNAVYGALTDCVKKSETIFKLQESVDLNTLTNIGTYHAMGDAIGNGCTNKPIANIFGFILEVKGTSGQSTRIQMLYTGLAGIYIRVSYNSGSTWQGWKTVIA